MRDFTNVVINNGYINKLNDEFKEKFLIITKYLKDNKAPPFISI